MNRRSFLRMAAAVPAVAAASQLAPFASPARAQQKEFAPRPGTWRTFEITTRVEVLEPAGVNRVWVPLPSVKCEYQRPLGDQWTGNAKVMKTATEPHYGATMLYAEFASGEAAPVTARSIGRSRAARTK